MKFHASAIALWAALTPIHQVVESWSTPSLLHRHQRSFASPTTTSIYQPFSSSTALFSSNNNDDLAAKIPFMGLNELQTQLRQAVAAEDFDAAKLFQTELAERVSSGAYRAPPTNTDGHYSDQDDQEEEYRKRQRLSWGGLGTAPWLMDRLRALEFPLPTTIQINSFEAVNAILDKANNIRNPNSSSSSNSNSNNQENQSFTIDFASDDTLEEKLSHIPTPQNMGIVISGSTGSGKTLAYLIPSLSTLSQTLYTRQRIRVKAEEDIADVAGDLVDRVMLQTSPMVRGQGYQRDVANASPIGARLSSSLGKSGMDVKSPVCLIVVPTRELGVQISLLLFQLVGGTVKRTGTERLSRRKNFFSYKGPKGVKIGCVLDEKMANEGLKLQTDIAITTPKYLTKLIAENDVDPSKLRVVIYDEADLGLEQTSPEDLKLLFENNNGGDDDENEKRREFSRISFLVGATVTESLGNLAVRDEILPEGNSFIATATRFAPLTKVDIDEGVVSSSIASSMGEDAATLKDLRLCLDPGLIHERLIAPDNSGMLSMIRMLRKELREYEEEQAALETGDGEATTTVGEGSSVAEQLREVRKETAEYFADPSSTFEMSNADSIRNLQRPRVVIFLPDEDSARAAIEPLRDAMWGDHQLCVLLPDSGQAPLAVMEDFRDGKTSVMLATPNSIRGLDFPALTHVYTLYLPVDDPREYLHLAGRVGRIGQQGSVSGKGGKVTTVLDPVDAPKMDQMAEFLGFDFIDVEPVKVEMTEQSNVEDMRRFLEDTITLLGTAERPEIDFSQVDSSYIDDDEEDDDDDEEDEADNY